MNASKSKRLLNFLIDSLVVSIIMNTIVVFMFYDLKTKQFEIGSIEKRFIVACGMIVYYFFCELIWNQTLGKKITKMKLNGSRPTFVSVLIRSLTRLIPFYPISLLGLSSRGLHDIFSQTKVVNIKD
jgi:uncharacterized RDD family membrane protein YckC